jgi:hypothetical protein
MFAPPGSDLPPLKLGTGAVRWLPLAQTGLDEKQAGSYVLQVASEPDVRAPRGRYIAEHRYGGLVQVWGASRRLALPGTLRDAGTVGWCRGMWYLFQPIAALTVHCQEIGLSTVLPVLGMRVGHSTTEGGMLPALSCAVLRCAILHLAEE